MQKQEESVSSQTLGNKVVELRPHPPSDQMIPAVQAIKAKSTFLGHVDLAKIVASKTNPRREFYEIDELAASIRREGGVLQPILVRPLPPARAKEVGPEVKYELICGERRFRATLKTGLTQIPAMSLDISDEEVIELQIVENGQRLDVHPMDEAEAFEALEKHLRAKCQDVLSEIAGRVAKSRAHIMRRMTLLLLPKSARTAFRKGTIAQDTALLIARIPTDKLRQSATEHIISDEDLRSPKAAREFIQDNFMLSLGDASFDRGDATLISKVGACVTCPKRTGNQRTLFADVEELDVCTDPTCFSAKQAADYQRRAHSAKAKGIEVLTSEASKLVFSHGQNLKYDSEYVTPDSVCTDDPKRRTWRQLLTKSTPQSILAQALNGAAVVLWNEREAKRLLKEHPPKEVQAAMASTTTRKNDLREERRKSAIQKEAKLRIHSEALTRVAKGCKEDVFLQALTCAVADVRGGYIGKVTTKALERLKYKSIGVLLEKGTASELRSFALECAIGDLAASWKAQEAIATIGGLLGVDLKATTKAVQAEWDAKRQNRKK